MNNLQLPDKYQNLVLSCQESFATKLSSQNNLTESESALLHYSIYRENNLHSILLSHTLNGLNASYYEAGSVFESLAYSYIDTLPTLLTTIHCYELIKSVGDESKKYTLLNTVLHSLKPLAFCLTEEHAGSDTISLKTNAIKNDKSFVITEKKEIVINDGIASFYLVVAKSNKKGRAGLNVFLIPENTKGITVQHHHVTGFNKCAIGSVDFNNIIVDENYQIGEEGSGYFLLTEMLDKGRPFVAACCVGGAQRAFDIITDHAKTRKQFSKPLFEFQSINFKIAEFATQLHAARLLYQDACNKIDNNEPFSKEASMAKYFASRLFLDITNFGIDIMGYKSIINASEIKHLNDVAQTMMFIDGTENVQKMIIASLI